MIYVLLPRGGQPGDGVSLGQAPRRGRAVRVHVQEKAARDPRRAAPPGIGPDSVQERRTAAGIRLESWTVPIPSESGAWELEHDVPAREHWYLRLGTLVPHALEARPYNSYKACPGQCSRPRRATVWNMKML